MSLTEKSGQSCLLGFAAVQLHALPCYGRRRPFCSAGQQTSATAHKDSV